MRYPNKLTFIRFLFIDCHNSGGHFPGCQNVYGSFTKWARSIEPRQSKVLTFGIGYM